MFRNMFLVFFFFFPCLANAQEYILWTEVPAAGVQWVDIVVPECLRNVYTAYLIRIQGLDADTVTVPSVQVSIDGTTYGTGNYYETGFSQWNGSLTGTAYSINLNQSGFQACPDVGERPSGQWTHLGCTGELRFDSVGVISNSYSHTRFSSIVSKGEWGYGPVPAGHRLAQLFGHGYWESPTADQGKKIIGWRFRADTRGATSAKLVSGRFTLYGIK